MDARDSRRFAGLFQRKCIDHAFKRGENRVCSNILRFREEVMSRFDEFADNLQQEVVSEMAEAYFGARKNIDDMVDVLEQWAEELRRWKPRLEKSAGRLHCLLLNQRLVRDFYITLDILPACVPQGTSSEEEFQKPGPFAFSFRGKYIKAVLDAYDDFQRLADIYLNGKYYENPDEKGRKRLTVHYIRFKAMLEYVNMEIEKVNSRMNTEDTLRYLKQMNPEMSEKEKVLDTCSGSLCAFGVDTEYRALELETYGLLQIQELPGREKVRNEITAFCKALYGEKKEEIKALLR